MFMPTPRGRPLLPVLGDGTSSQVFIGYLDLYRTFWKASFERGGRKEGEGGEGGGVRGGQREQLRACAHSKLNILCSLPNPW
jgi:hypothetical protein